MFNVVGRLSRSQLSKEQLKFYINEENNRRRNLLQKYIRLCTDAKVCVCVCEKAFLFFSFLFFFSVLSQTLLDGLMIDWYFHVTGDCGHNASREQHDNQSNPWSYSCPKHYQPCYRNQKAALPKVWFPVFFPSQFLEKYIMVTERKWSQEKLIKQKVTNVYNLSKQIKGQYWVWNLILVWCVKPWAWTIN